MKMLTKTREKLVTIYDIWKKIDTSSDPDEATRSFRRMTWVKARAFPYYLKRADAKAELQRVLSASDADAKAFYKIVPHKITSRMLDQDIAQGKVLL